MSDLTQRLSSLGLDKYATTFTEAEVDLGDLPHLTSDDLKDLGLPLDPRRRIEAAIKLLDGESESATSSPSSAIPLPPATHQADSTPTDAERRQLTVMFVDLVGSTEMATKSAFEYAPVLADKLGDTPMRYPVLYGLWVGMFVRSEHAEALAQAEALVHLAENSRDTAPQVVAHRLAGTSLCQLGRLSEAQTRLDCALALYDPINHTGLESRFGQDVGTTIHTYLAINLALLAESQRAVTHAQEAGRSALASGHANTKCYAHCHLGLLALLAQDEAEVARHAAAMFEIATEHELDLWLQYVALFQHLLAAGKGDGMSIARYTETCAAGTPSLFKCCSLS